MEEEWRVINDYNTYSVSNLGKIRNNKTGRILKSCLTDWGYLHVWLFKNGIGKGYSIHRLVGIHFLPNCENKEEIDHLNHDKLDNNVDNLRWATRSEQTANRTKWKNTSSKFVGVCFDKNNNKWKANIRCQKLNGGKQQHLGYFKTEEEGALAYNQFIIDNHLEEFYNLNLL